MSSQSAWYRAHARWILTALAALVFALAWHSTRAPASRSAEHPEMELMPGQARALEPVLGRGATLPGGCAYTDADLDLDPAHITARYACPGRSAPVAFELYTTRIPRPLDGHTGRFGVVTSEGFPPALRDALLARVTAHESRLEWHIRGAPLPPPRVTATPDRSARTPPPDVAARTPYRRGAALNLDDMITHEPALPLAALLVLLLAFTVRLLRREPARVAAALAAITLAGALLRLGLSVDAPMNAHPFSRLIPLASDLYRGPLLAWLSGRGVDIPFTDVQSWSNLALSLVMPVAFFAHARLLLGDARTALVAAAMMAFLPMHIRFARSDVTFIASLLASSSTFIALYGSLTDPSRAWRLGCAVMLPVMSLATYSARPENMIFVLLDIGALGLYLRSDIPRRRLALAAALIAATAAYSAATDLMVRYRQNVGDGLDLATLRHAVAILFDTRFNTLLNPSMTPPPLPLLAVVGGVTLWRSGQRTRAIFLTVWLAAFFVVHSFIVPSSVAMQARYHLHLVSPFVLLAAAATPRVAALPRLAVLALAAWLALSPALHRGFIRDTDFTEMHEYAFLKRLRGRIDARCTVLEYMPAVELPRPQSFVASRVERMLMTLRGGIPSAPQVIQIGAVPSGATSPDVRESLALTDDVIAHPPPCTYYFESAACTIFRPVDRALAAPCAEMHRRFALTPVAEARHALRPYDDVILRRVLTWPDGRVTVRMNRDSFTVHLGLYRVGARP